LVNASSGYLTAKNREEDYPKNTRIKAEDSTKSKIDVEEELENFLTLEESDAMVAQTRPSSKSV
jgi:hypothetical protein